MRTQCSQSRTASLFEKLNPTAPGTCRKVVTVPSLNGGIRGDASALLGGTTVGSSQATGQSLNVAFDPNQHRTHRCMLSP